VRPSGLDMLRCVLCRANRMTDCLLVWGAGGHGKMVLDVALSLERFERIIFLDHDPAKHGRPFCGCDVIGGAERLPELAGVPFVVAVGDNRARAHGSRSPQGYYWAFCKHWSRDGGDGRSDRQRWHSDRRQLHHKQRRRVRTRL
jgi:hypothetical protein